MICFVGRGYVEGWLGVLRCAVLGYGGLVRLRVSTGGMFGWERLSGYELMEMMDGATKE
jgi:hypothetical protein